MSSFADLTDHRVLPLEPYATLAAYLAAGGGAGLSDARAVTADVVLDELEASGLRGRGGAGFPTATKWRTVAAYASGVLRTSVVVNAAEGEPGTFKDRAILRANPYAVIEGALIAARVVGSHSITIAVKRRFVDELARLRAAVEEVQVAGWSDGIVIEIVEGPSEYLFGEETGLLEAIDGRPPFPRIAPPWRRGLVEVVLDRSDLGSGSGLAGEVQMASEASSSIAPPALVNNVETMANVPAIIAKGAAWFRSVGTDDSPGTVICTVSGAGRSPSVIEVAFGEPLREVLDHAIVVNDDIEVTGRRPILAVLMGVSNAILTAEHLDTPITHEDMKRAGSGLGSASFIVVEEGTDPLAVAAGVSRFLAVESCGQCTPCKQGGLAVYESLRSMLVQGGTGRDRVAVDRLLGTLTDGARCNLATQHQLVVRSILDTFDDEIRTHLQPGHTSGVPVLITELMSLDDGPESVDGSFLSKRADWTFNDNRSAARLTDPVDDPGRSAVDRFGDHRSGNNAPM